MPTILQPLGTVTCGYTYDRVPSQPDGNCHLNVDETMALRSNADYISGISGLFECQLGVVPFVGPFLYLRQQFYWWGGGSDLIRWGEAFDIRLDGVQITTSKDVYMGTGPLGLEEWRTGQITWNIGEFLTGLTGLQWNSAGQRTMRRLQVNADVIVEEPDPWTG